MSEGVKGMTLGQAKAAGRGLYFANQYAHERELIYLNQNSLGVWFVLMLGTESRFEPERFENFNGPIVEEPRT